MANDRKLRPIFRWAGSKKQLLSVLIRYWGNGYNRYIEPFTGSASLFYAINPRRAVLSDLNEELINTYRTVKYWPNEVYGHFLQLPTGEASYYTIRSMDVTGLSAIETAARFLYLNRYCFNGLYRTNQKGSFNVPYSKVETGKIHSRESFLLSAQALARARILCDDFEQVLDIAKDGDFVYLDPPYAVNGRKVFREYGVKCFGPEDLERLARKLRTLRTQGVHFVVSYADCPEARETLGQWNILPVNTQRKIAGDIRFRRRDAELLVSSQLIPEE